MTRKIHAFMLMGLLFAFCYLGLIPMVWTVLVRGRTGITQGGKRFEIDGVMPWPSHHLYCYQGWWIQDNTWSHTQQDGSVWTHSRPTARPGYCYVVQLDLEGRKP